MARPSEPTITLIDRWGHDSTLPCHVLCQPGSPNPIVYRPDLLPWEDAWALVRETVVLLAGAA